MTRINSVLGPIDTGDLSFTLMHEHILVGSAGIAHTYPELVDRERALEKAVAELKEAAQEGLRTFVDVTTFDLGRDIGLIQEVARRSGVHIIAATGTWLDIPRAFWGGATADQVADLYVREIEEGIEGTGIRAGIIKVANDQDGVTEAGELILRAAARAHQRTDVPISTHTYAPGRVGELQAAIFEEEGVDLRRVYIGHSNDTDDVDYLAGLCRRGCFIGMDRYPGGRLGGLNWEQRTETVKRLADAGFAGQVMLSHDFPLTFTIARTTDEERLRYNPHGIRFISRRVLPRLREMGVAEETIHTMMVKTPQRFFEGA